MNDVPGCRSPDGNLIGRFVASGRRVRRDPEIVLQKIRGAFHFDFSFLYCGLRTRHLLAGHLHLLSRTRFQLQQPLGSIVIALRLRHGGFGAAPFRHRRAILGARVTHFIGVVPRQYLILANVIA